MINKIVNRKKLDICLKNSFCHLKKMMILTVGISLSGCTGYSSKFDCPYGSGMGCSSLSTVNKVIDSNALDRESDFQSLERLENNPSVMIYFGEDSPSELVPSLKMDD